MLRPSELTDRSLSILHAVVQTYIETGEPVASRTIARRIKENLSPASIRNIMMDLYENGYLSQPHTSAGRIPTQKAFQSYVSSLAARKIPSSESLRLRHELGEIGSMQARIERSSRLLMEMTQSVGIAAAIPNSSQTFERVDLMDLGERRVLMVVVTRDQIVRDRVVVLKEQMTQMELDSIRNYLNTNFGGWSLAAIQSELEKRLQQESAAYDEILKKLALLYDQGLLDVGLVPELHIVGASNLLGVDLHLTKEKLRELFRALEQKKKILMLLDCFLEHPNGEVGVQIGLSGVDPSMSQFSLIGLTVTLPNGLTGRVAVLGPMRMNYQRTISAVLFVGRAFQGIQG